MKMDIGVEIIELKKHNNMITIDDYAISSTEDYKCIKIILL